MGRGGSVGGWDAFLGSVLNMQANASLRGETVAVLGHVHTADLQARAAAQEAAGEASVMVLRGLVEELDERVEAVAGEVLRGGLELVVVGGGHNNCLPLIRAARVAQGGAALSVRDHQRVGLNRHTLSFGGALKL